MVQTKCTRQNLKVAVKNVQKHCRNQFIPEGAGGPSLYRLGRSGRSEVSAPPTSPGSSHRPTLTGRATPPVSPPAALHQVGHRFHHLPWSPFLGVDVHGCLDGARQPSLRAVLRFQSRVAAEGGGSGTRAPPPLTFAASPGLAPVIDVRTPAHLRASGSRRAFIHPLFEVSPCKVRHR